MINSMSGLKRKFLDKKRGIAHVKEKIMASDFKNTRRLVLEKIFFNPINGLEIICSVSMASIAMVPTIAMFTKIARQGKKNSLPYLLTGKSNESAMKSLASPALHRRLA